MTDKNKKILYKMIVILILTIASVTMIIPFVWMISASFKTEYDVFAIPIEWIPKSPILTNYSDIWTRVPFLTYYKNTTIIAVSVTLIQILTCSLAGYSFSKINFKGRDTIFLFYLSTLMIPYAVIMIPQYFIIQKLHLADNLWALILLGAFSPFGVFLFRQFFVSIPDELSEAARIDGCSEFGIYSRIIMPNSIPAMTSLAIFTFVFHWNDFMSPLIYLTSDSNKTLQIGMRGFQTQYSQSYALTMAAAVVAILPVIVLYFTAQDLFVEGVATAGVKG